MIEAFLLAIIALLVSPAPKQSTITAVVISIYVIGIGLVIAFLA